MNRAFTDSEVEHLLSFIGYGNLSAPIWFLGMEEGGGGEDNLRCRLTFDSVEDLYTGHKKLGIVKHHEGRRIIQPTWRAMCVIMLELMGKVVNREEIRRYQADELGRSGKTTFLLELMPLPKPRIGTWSYDDLLPQFYSREDYYDRILPKRIIYLRKILERHLPDVVIGYGKDYWKHFRRLFPDNLFIDEAPYQKSEGYPSVILCHHFTSKTMNGRFVEIAQMIHSTLNNHSA